MFTLFSLDAFGKTNLTLDQLTDDAERISEACCNELVGYPPLLQATALLDVHSTFLSGFDSLDARREVLEMHTRSVLRLAEIKFQERADAERAATQRAT
jgi:hypothetical protein